MSSLTVFAWLLTYLIHSTVLLGAAWLVTRRNRLQPAASDLLWKVALIAPLITGTIQSKLDMRTPAAVRLPVAVQPYTPTQAQTPFLPATDKNDAAGPTVERAAAGSRLPSLTTLAVLLWAVVALGTSLYYVARRLILVGRLADRRAVAGGPLSAMLADLKREVGLNRPVRLTMARTISSPVALGVTEICVPGSPSRT